MMPANISGHYQCLCPAFHQAAGVAGGLVSLHQGLNGYVSGSLHISGNYLMLLQGLLYEEAGWGILRLRACGLKGDVTEGWRYDCLGILTPAWSPAMPDVPAVTGSVICTASHVRARTGDSASFCLLSFP